MVSSLRQGLLGVSPFLPPNYSSSFRIKFNFFFQNKCSCDRTTHNSKPFTTKWSLSGGWVGKALSVKKNYNLVAKIKNM